MSARQLIIAHDLGTSGDKASLHAADGRLLASHTVRYGTEFGPGGTAEQDPREWWSAFCAATRRLLSETGSAAGEIACVAMSGQMQSLVLVDDRDEPLRPAIIWADTRAGAERDLLAQRVGDDRAFEILGHRLDPSYTLAKAMWVRAHEPELFARADGILVAKDYLTLCATGRRCTDPSDASGTNAFDQRAGSVVRRAARGRRARWRAAAGAAAFRDRRGRAHRRGGRGNRAAAGYARRRRWWRWCLRRAGGWPGRPWLRRQCHHRLQRLAVGRHGGAGARSAAADGDLRPRHPRPLPAPGGDAGRRVLARLAGRDARGRPGSRAAGPAHGRRRDQGGRRGPLLPALPAGRTSSRCGTRACAGPSWAWPATTAAHTWLVPFSRG